MTTALKTIVMPENDEMLRRLVGVMDELHAREFFYPLILKGARRELNGMGVVLMVTLAIEDYTNELPPIMKSIVYMRLRDFVSALIDDEQVKQDAFEMLDSVNAKRGSQLL